MGEAFLHGHGSGLRFRKLIASLAAPHNVFYNGQEIDISNAVIRADFGRGYVRIAPEDCIVTPEVASTGLTSVTVSHTFGGTTRSTTIPITVIATNDVFNLNSWDVIAQAAYYGFAKMIWHLGDEKTDITVSGMPTWRIIGFDHDDLSPSDAKYNDPLYNRGSKKAALAIQWKTPAGYGPMVSFDERAHSGYWWKQCAMRLTTLPNLLSSMPTGLRNNVRTVDKWCPMNAVLGSHVTDFEKIAETIFLLDHFDSNYQMIAEDTAWQSYTDFWRSLETYYPFFAYNPSTDYSFCGYKIGDYQSYAPSNGEWSRTYGGSYNSTAFLRLCPQGERIVYKDWYYTNLPYFPVFNF